jgi:hypothetical protein
MHAMNGVWSVVCPGDALYVPSNADELFNIGFTAIKCDETQCNMDEMMPHNWTGPPCLHRQEVSGESSAGTVSSSNHQ